MSTCFSAQSAAAADSDLPARSQKQLIAAAKSGRRAPFGKLCERHRKPVSWGTRRIMRKPEDAGDAAQECFLNAFFERKDFDGRSQFATWLTRIALNAALMKRRKKRGARAFPIDEPNPSSAPVPQREFRCDSRSAKEVLPSWRETDREVSHFGAAAAELATWWSSSTCKDTQSEKLYKFWGFRSGCENCAASNTLAAKCRQL